MNTLFSQIPFDRAVDFNPVLLLPNNVRTEDTSVSAFQDTAGNDGHCVDCDGKTGKISILDGKRICPQVRLTREHESSLFANFVPRN